MHIGVRRQLADPFRICSSIGKTTWRQLSTFVDLKSSWDVDLGGGETLTKGGREAVGRRGVIQTTGPDACKFLQGLITNDVAHLSSKGHDAPVAAAFLTAKGRIIADSIITVASDAQDAPGGPGKLLIDVPLEVKDAILRHLRLYKLRSKVVIKDLTASAAVRVGIGMKVDEAKSLWGSNALGIGTDPRADGLGIRIIVPKDHSTALPTVGSLDAYEALRLLHGVAEGPDLIEKLPSECNFDLTHGICFNKGCYIGQELTARTQFKGVVRKRLLPFYTQSIEGPSSSYPEPAPLSSLSGLLPSSSTAPSAADLLSAPFLTKFTDIDDKNAVIGPDKGAEIVDEVSGKKVGNVISIANGSNLGLALLRLENVMQGHVQLTTTVEDTESSIIGAKFHLTAFKPIWWPAIDVRTGKV